MILRAGIAVSALAFGAHADLYAVGQSEFFVAKYYRVSTEDASADLIASNPEGIYATWIEPGPDGRHYTVDAGPYLNRANPLTAESEFLACVCAQQFPTGLAVRGDGVAFVPMTAWGGNYLYRYDVYADAPLAKVEFGDPKEEVWSPVFRSDGVMLGTRGWMDGHQVVTIDPETGATSAMGELEGDFDYVTDMATDPATGLTYFVASNQFDELLYQVDLYTLETTLIGPLPTGAEIWGIAGIVCPADFSGDGALSVLDFVAFQQAWQAGQGSADVNGDGALDELDFAAFKQLFQEGCT